MAVKKQQYNIELVRGRDFTQQFSLFNKETGATLNISSYTLKSEIRKSMKIASTLLVEGGFSIDDSQAASGIFVLSLTDTQTLALTDSKGYYDIVFTVGGISESWFWGEVTIIDLPTDIST